MINVFDNHYILSTDTTSYVFRVMNTGHLEHLYYGKKIRVESVSDLKPLIEKRGYVPGNTNTYAGYVADDKASDIKDQDEAFTLENVRLEMSSYGKGDIRQPFIEAVNGDGSMTLDFTFSMAKIRNDKPVYDKLPSSYYGKDEKPQTLEITLKDKDNKLKLIICYSVFGKANVITRMTRLVNEGEDDIRVRRLMSTMLDFEGIGYKIHTFNGAWAREMHHNETVVSSGCYINSSYTGTSSNRANPFVMISDPNTDENSGNVYGLNLVYSGNHFEALEVSPYNKTRFVSGINPASFDYVLESGCTFEAPEAVMTYSDKGFNGMSCNMHCFVRNNIVRGKYQFKERPVLLNSWEACYFDINENRLAGLAKKAAEVGCELFVMDDGWFAERNDDSHSLGDWDVNEKKLPGGLKGIADRINNIGLDFGIWVEPEMVNVNSRLYREHPQWAIEIPGKTHSEGRNQRLLDFTNPEVVDYMTEKMRKVFSSANISYVKWDMNRTFTDIFSSGYDSSRQGQVLYDYVTGLYKMMGDLVREFPDILFEGCASGGNRFDLGVLCFFPQIWASDDTDALERTMIQTGYSYGYPQSCYTCHVSGVPNHQTLRKTPLETRFNVASFGVLGYECNLKDADREELGAIASQISYYKKNRSLLQYGQMYRGRIVEKDNIAEWTVVSEDRKDAMAFMLQNRVVPNMPTQKLNVYGLNPVYRYIMTQRSLKYSVKDFGDLVNTVAPVHVRQDSLIHNAIDKFYKLNGEDDGITSYGDVIMNAGIYLTQNFSGTGLNDNVRHFQDCSSRIYRLTMV